MNMQRGHLRDNGGIIQWENWATRLEEKLNDMREIRRMGVSWFLILYSPATYVADTMNNDKFSKSIRFYLYYGVWLGLDQNKIVSNFIF